MRNPVRLKNLRLRFLPAALAAALCVVWLEPRTGAIAAGSGLIVLGLAVRAWGAGHLVKRERLITSGPYAHVRHPLYAGTLLICLGFGLALGPLGWLLASVVLLWFVARYFPAKERHESALLEQRYGGAYVRYRSQVPALIPDWRSSGFSRRSAGRDGAAAGSAKVGAAPARAAWSAAHYGDNNELGTALAVTAGLLLLALRTVAA